MNRNQLFRDGLLQRSFIKHLAPMITTSVVAGIILAILSPYGTGEFRFLTRLLFWTGLCIAGGFGAGGFDGVLSRTGRTLKPWQQALGQSISATLMVAVFYLGITWVQYGLPTLANIVTLLFYIWVISIVISSIGMLMRSRKSIALETQPRPALIDRLKPHLRSAEIYALSAEDHYVRVMTSKGDDLILMRLSDAIKEIAPLPGLSPHRSWWVAESGVKHVKKVNGKLSLELNNESIAPVSRNAAKTLREAGWV